LGPCTIRNLLSRHIINFCLSSRSSYIRPHFLVLGWHNLHRDLCRTEPQSFLLFVVCFFLQLCKNVVGNVLEIGQALKILYNERNLLLCCCFGKTDQKVDDVLKVLDFDIVFTFILPQNFVFFESSYELRSDLVFYLFGAIVDLVESSDFSTRVS
jgi:hypothetical protein